MPKTIGFRPTEEQELEIIKTMQQKGCTKSDALKHLLDLTLKKLDADYTFFENPCPALTYGTTDDPQYECVWGREGRTPDIKKLGKDLTKIKYRCQSCTKTLELKKENRDLREQITKGMIMKIPSCILGGKISEDGKKLYCNMVYEYRDAHKVCKTLKNLKNGANCKNLRWTTITVKGKLPEKDNR